MLPSTRPSEHMLWQLWARSENPHVRAKTAGSSARSTYPDPEHSGKREAAKLARLQLKARGVRVPEPMTHLASGTNGGEVFSTTDEEIVVRVGEAAPGWGSDNEPLLLDPRFRLGVVHVYGQIDVSFLEEIYRVTWKERLRTDWYQYLREKYGDEDEEGPTRMIEHAFDLLCRGEGREENRYDPKEAQGIFEWYPETRGLAQALEAGLPDFDLQGGWNIGVTKDGRLVAYDL